MWIVIAGPGNSQIKHGRIGVRGHGPETKIVYTKNCCSKEGISSDRFSKEQYREKVKLVDLLEQVINGIRSDKTSDIRITLQIKLDNNNKLP
jgi:hypothetical protein